MPAFSRTLMTHRGRIAAAGPTAEVVMPERLAEIYDVEMRELLRADGRLWPCLRAR
jgi:ABC-type cobalamin/Fe3+-siderophores transport system ATPase subunit